MVKFSSPVLCLTLWCCLTVAIVQSSEDGRPERFPLNQAGTCLEQSEITENTIIRTKDSRALGARFLNETSLGLNSRDQCLRLCCSFHGCNVAVYEEKDGGNCYLFDCGRADDFRCKFTSHSHYSSAIIRENAHEEELAQLKKSVLIFKCVIIITLFSSLTLTEWLIKIMVLNCIFHSHCLFEKFIENGCNSST